MNEELWDILLSQGWTRQWIQLTPELSPRWIYIDPKGLEHMDEPDWRDVE